MSKKEIGMTIGDIESTFGQMVVEEPRRAAELAYVIAMTAKSQGNSEKAILYGKKSIELFDQVNVQSIDDCAALYVVVNDIALPSIIHQDVVRENLWPLSI